MLSYDAFVDRAEQANFRFFMVSTSYESRRNVTGQSTVIKRDAAVYRFGTYLEPVLNKLEPLSRDAFTAVYDGRDVLRLLKERQGG